MSSEPVKLVLFGPPGAGKGTAAAQLVGDLPSGAYLATGDHFRRLIRDGDPRSDTFAKYMEAGQLIPDDIVLNEVGSLWESGRFDRGFVFDGFPRTIIQARWLDAQLEARELGPLTAVAYIQVPRDEVLRRLTTRRVCPNCGAIYNIVSMPPKRPGICDRCGHAIEQRPDDTEETIQRRLHVYDAQTAEIINYYRSNGVLIDIDGTIGSENVLARIESAL